MLTTYSIHYLNRPVGKATVIPQGLYYSISCFCDLDGDEIYEVVFSQKDTRHNLGVLVPEDGRLVLTKKIPAKFFTEDELSFYIVVRERIELLNFVAVEKTLPFPYIAQLEHAVMRKKDGKTGVCFLE